MPTLIATLTFARPTGGNPNPEIVDLTRRINALGMQVVQVETAPDVLCLTVQLESEISIYSPEEARHEFLRAAMGRLDYDALEVLPELCEIDESEFAMG
jgi:hypothetical protein